MGGERALGLGVCQSVPCFVCAANVNNFATIYYPLQFHCVEQRPVGESSNGSWLDKRM